MKRQFLYLIIGLLFNLNSYAICHSGGIERDSINDGPYFYFENEELKVRWIENNEANEFYVSRNNFIELKDKFRLPCNYEDLSSALFLRPHYGQSYREIDSIGVISDVHGDYNSYLNLLKGTGIIDNDLNWKFGKGHLVVLGDIFDRGDMVTETLWHLFCLEKQAAKD